MSEGLVILMLRSEPCTTWTSWPSFSIKPGLVGRVHAIFFGFGERVLQELRFEDLRSLRQHHALARNRRGDQRNIFRQAGALHFLHRVHGRNGQNRGFAPARFLDHARDLFNGNERPYRVVHDN